MDTIEDLIKYSNENSYLEIKLIEYRGEIRGNLIKDVMALANSNYTGDRYIVIGVKKHAGDIELNEIESPEDSAGIQQYIHENIEPELEIKYEPFLFEGHKLALLTICNPTDQPYLAIKDISNKKAKLVSKHDCFIRKGTHQLRLSRSDLDRMYAKKYESTGLAGKLDLTFEDGAKSLEIPCVRDIQLPSLVEALEIQKELQLKDRMQGRELLERVDHYYSSGAPEDRYKSLSIPQLEERLSTVKMNYFSSDIHYMQELRSYKLNLKLKNNGEIFLEKGLVKLVIPITEYLIVVKTIPLNDHHQAVPSFAPIYDYPEVIYEKEEVIVTYEVGEVRHGLSKMVFKDALRIVPFEQLAGTGIKINAQIHAANLKVQQSFELSLTFV
ncbi:MAG: ATP-binding protein [Bacteroidetes bacterium]|nr:ATP-binding protein [Bacteroidota bacterium]